MSIFNSHLTDFSATYDIVLNICFWFFLSLLVLRLEVSVLGLHPIHTFGVLIVAHSFTRCSRFRWIPCSEWPQEMPCGTERLRSWDRLTFLIHKTVSYKKKKKGFQPLNFRVISLAATDNYKKYRIFADDSQISWTSPLNSRFVSNHISDISTWTSLILASTRSRLQDKDSGASSLFERWSKETAVE